MQKYSFLILFFLGMVLGYAQVKTHIGVWELYDKYALTDSCVATNPNELKNNKDDDQNGYIDDLNGVYFNEKEEITPHYFYTSHENLENFNHGTAVANLTCQENPNVEILGVGFVPTAQRLKQSGILDLSAAQRQAHLPKEYQQMQYFVSQSLAWFSLQKVQLVNISWGLNLSSFVENNQNLGSINIEREHYPKQWLQTFKTILENEFKKYPEITFVAAAGNEGLEVNLVIDVPGSIVANNVVVVGALGKDGKKASLSNLRKNVTHWALGEEVEVTQALKTKATVSGTSFATPVITAQLAKERDTISKDIPSKNIKNHK
jgi:hypothetical protein